jgi:hypothetical protein
VTRSRRSLARWNASARRSRGRPAPRLDWPGLLARVGASAMTLGGLLKHLAGLRRFTVYLPVRLLGRAPGPPWDRWDWEAEPDRPFTSAADDSPDELMAQSPSAGGGALGYPRTTSPKSSATRHRTPAARRATGRRPLPRSTSAATPDAEAVPELRAHAAGVGLTGRCTVGAAVTCARGHSGIAP